MKYRRLTEPLARIDGGLQPTSWDDALSRVASGLAPYRGSEFGMFSCSKATNETNYLAQKFARVVMGSHNVDSCNRT
jgi:predicted molibdopterin-dependent oxidoreductase YjgC